MRAVVSTTRTRITGRHPVGNFAVTSMPLNSFVSYFGGGALLAAIVIPRGIEHASVLAVAGEPQDALDAILLPSSEV
jgi:hypothetical protein